MRPARVDVVFTDTKGRRWLVYDWAVIAGIRYRRQPGEGHSDYRGFLLRATGEKRIYAHTGPRPSVERPRVSSCKALPSLQQGADTGYP